MKRSLSTLAAVTVLSIASSKVFATATTHIWAPSTDVQAFNLWHITSDMYLPAQMDGLPGGGTQRLPAITNLGLTVGFLPFEKVQAEVGFDHKSGYGTLDSYPLYFNAKVGIPEKALGRYTPALAVGVLDLGTKKDVTDFNVAYSKAAYSVPAIGRMSLGFFIGNEKLLLDGKGKKDNAGVMVAWERTMTELTDKLWLCVDYMGTKSSYGTFSFGFAWKAGDNVSLLAGYDILSDPDLAGAENSLTVQMDIDLKLLGK